MAITASLTTVVRNTSGKTLSFGCLPRSKRLTPGQHLTIDGCLLTKLHDNKRKLQALHRALTTGKLAIVSSPNPHLYDDVRDETKVLQLANGTLGVTNPSWGDYSSSLDQGEDGV